MATVKMIALVESNDLDTLQEMAKVSGLPLDKFNGELIGTKIAEYRLLRIPPSQVFTARDDDDKDDELVWRKPQCVLTVEQEGDVCRMFAQGLGGSQIAQRLGVSPPTIYRILVRCIPDYPHQIHRRRKAAQK